MKQVEILIDENGDCSIEGRGFHGPECESVIKEIEAAIGVTESRQHKPEYRRVATRRQTQRGS